LIEGRHDHGRRHDGRGSVILAGLLFAGILLAGCGGDSSGGGDTPTGPSPALVFTPDRPNGPGSVALRQGSDTTVAFLAVDVVATELTDVATMDFTVVFPGAVLSFAGARQGDFLGPGTNLIVSSTTADSVTVLLTRTAGGGATGSGTALSLDFEVTGAGEGQLDFFDPVAEDSTGLDVPVDWIGASVRVVR